MYPAVGYVAMAVEAARQMAEAATVGAEGDIDRPKVRAFYLRDVEFLAAT